MKKRVLLIVMAIAMAMSLTACGSKETATDRGVSKVDEETEVVEEEEEVVEVEEEEEEKTEASGTPTLGNDVENYDGFEYLEAYKVEGEDADAVVYLPIDEYAYEGSNYASAESYGVTVRIELEPYIQLDQEDYTMEENLEEYMAGSYEFDEFYTTDYKDVEVSEINVISKEAATVVMSRLEYDSYEEEYYYVWKMYYLLRTEDDRMFMTEVEINSRDLTGYAEDLLAEVETYLGMELEFDEAEMQAKVDNYDPSTEGNVYSTGYWLFELPEGWAEDTSMSSYEQYAYAPNGDVAEAECAIMIQSEYLGEDTSVLSELEDDQMVTFLETFMPEDISNPECSVVGETAVGYTLKAAFVYEGVNVEAYFVFDDYYTHTVMAMQYGDDEEVFDAAEQIINTAQTK